MIASRVEYLELSVAGGPVPAPLLGLRILVVGAKG